MIRPVHNFSAGPCTLPEEVLAAAADEMLDFHESGMSIVEVSHRGPEYEAVHAEAQQLVRDLYGVPGDFDILFLQGGATLQFGMIPMAFLGPDTSAAYVDTGNWASKAIADARLVGDVDVVWSGEDEAYTRTPAADEVEVDPAARYLHITSNETIGGIRFFEWPDVEAPIVADMSSDYMSRPIPWDRFGLVYGGVQKNLAPAGMALVIVRKSFLDTARTDLPAYLRYDIHASKDSMYNTPPVFPVYIMGKVLRWMQERGGLSAIAKAAEEKATMLYDAIDGSDGFYRCPVDERSRSRMNVVFRLPTPALEERFVVEAAEKGLRYLEGHRSVGGCRASLYNAMPVDGVAALVAFMDDFARVHPAR